MFIPKDSLVWENGRFYQCIKSVYTDIVTDDDFKSYNGVTSEELKKMQRVDVSDTLTLYLKRWAKNLPTEDV